MPLLIATTNPGKAREIDLLLKDVPVRLMSLRDLPAMAEPEETGRTFAENAVLKARYYARASGIPAVAEDSGLAIDALEGAPGIHSARYPGHTYPEKFRHLYRALARHPRPWTARFVCSLAVLAVVEGDGRDVLFATEAIVEGEIAAEPRGTSGFGYDPIFYIPAYGRTLGEVGEVEKLAVAHRGKAFRILRDWLQANPSIQSSSLR